MHNFERKKNIFLTLLYVVFRFNYKFLTNYVIDTYIRKVPPGYVETSRSSVPKLSTYYKDIYFFILILYFLCLSFVLVKCINFNFFVFEKVNSFYQIFQTSKTFSFLNLFDTFFIIKFKIITSSFDSFLNYYINLKSVGFIFLTWLLLAVGLLGIVAFFTLLERKVLAALQHRKGPDIAGFFGILQPIADGAKLIKKQNITPASSNSLIFKISPILVFCLALTTWSVISLDYEAQIVSLDFEILFILAISSLGVYGIILGGWSSNSKYAFLGALRSTGQMLSYEIALGLSILPVVLITGSFKLSEIVAYQAISFLPLLFMIFPSFIVFLISMLVETNRHPFDLPEAEAELVAGYNVEYGAFSFALFFLAEYASMILMSVLITLLFAGGWDMMISLINCENQWAFTSDPFFFTKMITKCDENTFNFFYSTIFLNTFLKEQLWQIPTFFEQIGFFEKTLPKSSDIFYSPSVTNKILLTLNENTILSPEFMNHNEIKNFSYIIKNNFNFIQHGESIKFENDIDINKFVYLLINHEASVLFFNTHNYFDSINNYFDSSSYLTFIVSDFSKLNFFFSNFLFKIQLFLNKIMYYLTYVFISTFFFFKVSLIYYFFVLVRGFLPRTRPDQLMSFGWKVLLPFAFGFLVYIIGFLFYYDFAPIIAIFINS